MKVRFADIEDAEELYRWRTDEATMKFSLSQSKFTLGTHMVWFKGSLEDKKRVILIAVMEDGAKAGMVRFDEADKDSSEVSIAVSPDMRGRGVGTDLLTIGCRTYLQNWDKSRILATIKKVNEASIRLFTKCGFVTKSEDDRSVVMELEDELS